MTVSLFGGALLALIFAAQSAQPATLQIQLTNDGCAPQPPSIAADKGHHLYVGYTAAPGAVGVSGSKYWDAMVAAPRRARAPYHAPGLNGHRKPVATPRHVPARMLS